MVKDDDFDFGFDGLFSDIENRLQLILTILNKESTL